jgi:hypothetical protein
MTKQEIINELHKRGCFWANMTYSKKALQDYLNGAKKAEEMTLEELEEHIRRTNK